MKHKFLFQTRKYTAFYTSGSQTFLVSFFLDLSPPAANQENDLKCDLAISKYNY
jgi:hypothetical protein